MKNIDLQEVNKFNTDKPYRELLYDGPNLRLLAFNFEPGQELPVHSHPADSDVILMVLEGEGEFTGANQMPVCEPHGLKAHTRMRLLVLIAPTL